MLTHKQISALSEHGDTWCMDLKSAQNYLADLADGGERKKTPRIPKVSGSIAVIPIQGLMTKRGG